MLHKISFQMLSKGRKKIAGGSKFGTTRAAWWLWSAVASGIRVTFCAWHEFLMSPGSYFRWCSTLPLSQSDCMVAAQDGPHEVLLWTHVLEMGVWTFGGCQTFPPCLTSSACFSRVRTWNSESGMQQGSEIQFKVTSGLNFLKKPSLGKQFIDLTMYDIFYGITVSIIRVSQTLCCTRKL